MPASEAPPPFPPLPRFLTFATPTGGRSPPFTRGRGAPLPKLRACMMLDSTVVCRRALGCEWGRDFQRM